MVRLSDAEREIVNRLSKQRHVSAQTVRRAHGLLQADADGPHGIDPQSAKAFDCSTNTVPHLRVRLVTAGFEPTLHGRRKQRVRGKVRDGAQQANIMARQLGQPPPDFATWTLRLRVAQAVAWAIVKSVSDATLRRTLKKSI